MKPDGAGYSTRQSNNSNQCEWKDENKYYRFYLTINLFVINQQSTCLVFPIFKPCFRTNINKKKKKEFYYLSKVLISISERYLNSVL